MYKIKITARTKRELKKFLHRHKKALGAVYEDLKENPYLGKPLTKELLGKYSYRVGVYRIIYTVECFSF